MKIPEKVRIGYMDYDVIQTENNLCLDGRECLGIIHYEDAKIELNINRNIQKQHQAFLHEVVHGIVRDRGIEWGENNELYTDEIAKGIYCLIRDNPEIFKECE